MINKKFDGLQITLASAADVEAWSNGKVTLPDTINYRTGKPKPNGLFCEKIFGPTKNFECSCGKYKGARYKGIVCERCGVEVTTARVRRERMGHIDLAAPVAHIWYVKATPSRFGLLLEISAKEIEKLLYFVKYVVTDYDEEKKQQAIEQLDETFAEKVAELDTIRTNEYESLEATKDELEP